MSLARRIARNSGVVLGGQAFTRLVNAAVFLAMTRLVTKSEVGRYSFIVAVFTIASMIPEMGTTQVLVREASRGRADKRSLLGNAILLRLGLGILVSAAVLVGFFGWEKDPELRGLALVGCGWLLVQSLVSMRAVFQSDLKMHVPVAVNIAGSVLFLVLAAAILLVTRRGALVYAALVVAASVQTIWLAHLAARVLQPDLRPSARLLKELSTASLPLALNGILMVLYSRVDQVMVRAMLGTEPLGLYAASAKLVEVWNIVPFALLTSLLPLLSRYATEGGDRFATLFEMAGKYLSLVILPVATATVFFAPDLMRWVFGAGFERGGVSLAILMWAEFFLYFLALFRDSLVSRNQPKLVLFFGAATVGVNIVANVVLIPWLGIAGAAVATLIAVTTLVPLTLRVEATRPLTRILIRVAARPAVACVPILVVFLAVPDRLLAFVLSPILYGLAIAALGVFDGRDARVIRDLWGKTRAAA